MNRKVWIVTLCLYLLIIPVFILERSATKDLESARARYREVSTLSVEYRSLKGRIDSIEQKGGARDVKGIAQVVNDISASLGMRVKMKSLRVAQGREIKGAMTEESAEVVMEGLDMNELVNLLYRIENAPMMLTVRGIKIRKSFNKPELLDITISLALFIKKGG